MEFWILCCYVPFNGERKLFDSLSTSAFLHSSGLELKLCFPFIGRSVLEPQEVLISKVSIYYLFLEVDFCLLFELL